MESIIHEDLATVENITPFLKQCVGKGKEIPTGNILQVQQVTNISFPTYDKPNFDSDKHTLKLTVTDGHSQGYALVADSCPGLSTNTAPGTKIRTTQPIPVHGSLFVLSRNNCEVLGGKVSKLFEKWEIQKKMAVKHDWGYTGSAVEGEGPPPWKPFGYKPSIDVSLLRKMKTTDVAKKDGQAGGAAKSQFDMQRDEAISELQATANKQKFQKPNKHLLDKEITDIMEEGFSQSDAEYAMNRFKNIQKALKFLKDSKKHQEGLPREPPKAPVERKDHRRKKGKGKDDEDEEQEVPREYQRPTKSISLFGFIEGQIKSEEKPANQNSNYDRRTQDLEDGMGRLNMKDWRSDSYRGRNDRGSGRGDRGGGGRGDRGSGRGDRGRGRGSYRGGGHIGHYDRDRDHDRDRDRDRDSYQSQNNRFESKGNKPDTTTTQPQQRPPRFQNRSQTNDIRPSSDYNHSSSSRNQSSGGGGSGNYDSYRDRGSNKDNYFDSRSYPPPTSNSSSRQDYSGSGSGGGYQSQHQQQQQQQRSSTGKEQRSYTSDYYYSQQQPQQQQQYLKSNDYPVPSQSYQQQQQQQQSYSHSQYQQSQSQSQGSRQYSNNNGQSREKMGYSSSSWQGEQQQQQRAAPPSSHQQSSYSNHSSSGHSANLPTHSEFTHYQYGYEGWNPTQSLVFTRSNKGDSRGGGRGGTGGGMGGGGGGGSGGGNGYSSSGGSRGASFQNNSYNNSRGNNRY